MPELLKPIKPTCETLVCLSHPLRLLVLKLLSQQIPPSSSWYRSNYLAQIFKVRPSIMSHHLCMLFSCGLIVKRTSGTSRFYAFNESSGLSFKNDCLTLVLREMDNVT